MAHVPINPNVFIPMPMTIVGSMHGGTPNFMAVGWGTRGNAQPPLLAIGINRSHLSHDCIVQNQAFSVNIPGQNLLVQTDHVGIVSGTKTDKSGVFDVFFGANPKVPLIRDAALALECRLAESIQLPTNTVFIGEIVAAWCEQEALTGTLPDWKKIMCFFLTMPDNTYWSLGDSLGKAWSSGLGYQK
jgi:flavin reductase (DIM6/NTAB) family NADH-FMN oxidoreductase RutF